MMLGVLGMTAAERSSGKRGRKHGVLALEKIARWRPLAPPCALTNALKMTQAGGAGGSSCETLVPLPRIAHPNGNGHSTGGVA